MAKASALSSCHKLRLYSLNVAKRCQNPCEDTLKGSHPVVASLWVTDRLDHLQMALLDSRFWHSTWHFVMLLWRVVISDLSDTDCNRRVHWSGPCYLPLLSLSLLSFSRRPQWFWVEDGDQHHCGPPKASQSLSNASFTHSVRFTMFVRSSHAVRRRKKLIVSSQFSPHHYRPPKASQSPSNCAFSASTCFSVLLCCSRVVRRREKPASRRKSSSQRMNLRSGTSLLLLQPISSHSLLEAIQKPFTWSNSPISCSLREQTQRYFRPAHRFPYIFSVLSITFSVRLLHSLWPILLLLFFQLHSTPYDERTSNECSIDSSKHDVRRWSFIK